MIKNPPKGFEEVVKLHFAIKSNFIMRIRLMGCKCSKR